MCCVIIYTLGGDDAVKSFHSQPCVVPIDHLTFYRNIRLHILEGILCVQYML